MSKKILILGDSTIDNRVWLGLEKYRLFIGNRFAFLHRIADFIDWLNPLKPKSVINNLRAEMPQVEFIDRTNDGFTTTDLLNGAYKDKVFGQGAHRFFPHKFFSPLKANKIIQADQIILSVGGNNFREFIQQALPIRDETQRKDFIKAEYPKVFQKMQQEYQDILKFIAKANPKANVVLMTQYYPALNQKTLLGTSIYDFMTILGDILNKGNAQDTIVEVMKESYNGILKFINTDPSLSKMNFSVVDVTSSLNPHASENYVGQIEPSSKGGKHIAQMLKYVSEKNSQQKNNKIYRFSPDFFATPHPSLVYSAVLSSQKTFSPVHPDLMVKPQSDWKKPAIIAISTLTIGSFALATWGLGSAIIAGILSAWLLTKVANQWSKNTSSTNNDSVYPFYVEEDNVSPKKVTKKPVLVNFPKSRNTSHAQNDPKQTTTPSNTAKKKM